MQRFAIVALLLGVAYASVQNVTVKGVTICDKKRMADVEIELWEHDTFDPDDSLKKLKTDAQGEFEAFGSTEEKTTIEPYLLIKHKCHTSKPGCVRTTKFEIPREKIGGVYDMTYVTLDILQKGDTEKCK